MQLLRDNLVGYMKRTYTSGLADISRLYGPLLKPSPQEAKQLHQPKRRLSQVRHLRPRRPRLLNRWIFPPKSLSNRKIKFVSTSWARLAARARGGCVPLKRGFPLPVEMRTSVSLIQSCVSFGAGFCALSEKIPRVAKICRSGNLRQLDKDYDPQWFAKILFPLLPQPIMCSSALDSHQFSPI